MHDAEAQPFSIFETGKFSENFFLRRPRQSGLKADQIECRARSVLFAQLHDGVRYFPRPRIGEPNRFERTESQHVITAIRHLLDWKATLEVADFLELFELVPRLRPQIVDELQIRISLERDVEIVVAFALVVARLTIHLGFVDRIRRDDRRRGVVVMQPPAADQTIDRIGQAGSGKRSAGDDRTPVERNFADLFAPQTDPRMRAYLRFDLVAEQDAIDSQGSAGRDGMLARRGQDERATAVQLFF